MSVRRYVRPATQTQPVCRNVGAQSGYLKGAVAFTWLNVWPRKVILVIRTGVAMFFERKIFGHLITRPTAN